MKTLTAARPVPPAIRTTACLLALALVLPAVTRAEPVTDLTITTSRSTLTLPALAGLTSENSLRQAGRLAEMALRESAADALALAPAEAAFAQAVEAYKQDQLATKTTLEAVAADYRQDLAVHDAETAQQVALARASNSLPADKRNPETVRRGTEWALKLGREVVALDARKRDFEARWAREDARLRAAYDGLVERENTLKAKLGLAYRQLKLCADYAGQIEQKLRESYRADGRYFIPGEALVGAKEQLKELSARGWDM